MEERGCITGGCLWLYLGKSMGQKQCIEGVFADKTLNISKKSF